MADNGCEVMQVVLLTEDKSLSLQAVMNLQVLQIHPDEMY